MSFSQEAGYTPATFETLMNLIREGVNSQFGTDYTTESFVGTNFYKYFYALVQTLQTNDIKTSEIFLKLQEYITETNEAISRPVVTPPGLIEKFQTEGYVASVKPMIDADAGKIYVCVDTDDEADDYDDVKLEICNIIKSSVAAGVVSQGSEVESIVLTNGQSFDFKFNLPNRIATSLRLTLATSENNQFEILSPEEIKALLLANIAAKYSLGKNFEPQKYFTTVDAPWAESVLLEWSTDAGATWNDTVFDANYDDLYEIPLENVSVVEL